MGDRVAYGGSAGGSPTTTPYHALYRLMDRAGVPHSGWPQLRHTAATLLAAADADHPVALGAARDGVVNLWNSMDLALVPARFGPTIGRVGLQGLQVLDIETRAGHAAQLEQFGDEVLRAHAAAVAFG